MYSESNNTVLWSSRIWITTAPGPVTYFYSCKRVNMSCTPFNYINISTKYPSYNKNIEVLLPTKNNHPNVRRSCDSWLGKKYIFKSVTHFIPSEGKELVESPQPRETCFHSRHFIFCIQTLIRNVWRFCLLELINYLPYNYKELST